MAKIKKAKNAQLLSRAQNLKHHCSASIPRSKFTLIPQRRIKSIHFPSHTNCINSSFHIAETYALTQNCLNWFVGIGIYCEQARSLGREKREGMRSAIYYKSINETLKKFFHTFFTFSIHHHIRSRSLAPTVSKVGSNKGDFFAGESVIER
jgi:hypothetical protein